MLEMLNKFLPFLHHIADTAAPADFPIAHALPSDAFTEDAIVIEETPEPALIGECLPRSSRQQMQNLHTA